MKLLHWRILLVLWMAAIYLASSGLFVSQFSAEATEEVLGLMNYVVRKLAHMTEFGVLVFLWFRSIEVESERFTGRLTVSLVLSIAYAITDEIHQSYVPQRLGIWTDVLWDAAGALLVALLLWRVWKTGSTCLRQRIMGPMCGHQGDDGSRMNQDNG